MEFKWMSSDCLKYPASTNNKFVSRFLYKKLYYLAYRIAIYVYDCLFFIKSQKFIITNQYKTSKIQIYSIKIVNTGQTLYYYHKTVDHNVLAAQYTYSSLSYHEQRKTLVPNAFACKSPKCPVYYSLTSHPRP